MDAADPDASRPAGAASKRGREEVGKSIRGAEGEPARYGASTDKLPKLVGAWKSGRKDLSTRIKDIARGNDAL